MRAEDPDRPRCGREPVNRLAIASLASACLLLAPVAVVLSFLAQRRLHRNDDRGLRMARAATHLATVQFAIAAVAALWLHWTREPAVEGPAGDSAARGDCYDFHVEHLSVVPCAEPHQGEVFATYRPSAAPEGTDAREQIELSVRKCEELESGAAYILDGWSVPEEGLAVEALWPRGTRWMGDDGPTVVCGYALPGELLEGSLRSDAHSLEPAQLTFLTAVNPLEAVCAEEPYADAGLPARQAWADEVADVVTGAAEALERADWPEPHAGPVADLATELRAGVSDWRQAAQAPDAAAFERHTADGAELLGHWRMVVARRELGLAY
ncbi:hypothetical protein WDH52_01505 [Streptomyces sp. TRM70308]|uniref:hypothetical protein n=1 Tax=Streptomyces sp. TRM70308 TaxID=3131932 RepID=UPI003D03F8A9